MAHLSRRDLDILTMPETLISTPPDDCALLRARIHESIPRAQADVATRGLAYQRAAKARDDARVEGEDDPLLITHVCGAKIELAAALTWLDFLLQRRYDLDLLARCDAAEGDTETVR